MANGFSEQLGIAGQGLQALGAGLSGRLPQFQESQQRQQILAQQQQQQQQQGQQQQEQQRKQALFQDVAVLHDHLSNGRTDAALQLVGQREQLLGQLGVDSQETQGIRALLQQGKTKEVLDIITPVLRAGQIRGLVDQTPSSKFIQMSKDGTQAFFQTPEGVVAQDIEGAKGGEAAKKANLKQLETDTKAQKTRFDQAKNLRAEITKTSDSFNKISKSFDRIKATAEDPSAAGDLALIFNFMKMLDPGSVVRESEFATAQNAAGVPERVRAQFNKLQTGERLGVKQRTDFINQSQNIFDASEKTNIRDVNKIVSIGKRFGIERGDLLGDEPRALDGAAQQETPTTLPAGLPPGTTDNGDGTFTLPTGERVRAKRGNS